jgi:DNA invertase Pin-like site-specific DNA recombinase
MKEVTGTRIAYIRVSTVDQNEERQIKNMNHLELDKMFIEKASAKDTNRPELNKLLDYIREGDTVYINDFSRLARSTKDLLELVELFQDKKVKLISIKENLDTSTANGKLMLTMLGAINEFERANLLERQREGIAIAKQKGKYQGRKKIEKPDNWDEVYDRWRSRALSAKEAMELMGLKRNTFYKFVNESIV